jgi:hypothetical protein
LLIFSATFHIRSRCQQFEKQKTEMKKLLILIVLIYTNIGFSQSKAIDSIQIKATEISAEYKISEKLECQAIQSKLLYENPEMYSFILGKTINKRFQTFEYDGKKGSILYFEFDKEAENGKGFIEGLLWGGKKPNKAHPEQVITKGKIMIILSFPFKSKIGKELTELLTEK